MKNVEAKLVPLLLKGNCTPQIVRLAKQTKEPPTTLHYNIKRMEREGKIRAYKAVFDYGKIGRGFCTYVLVNLAEGGHRDPDRAAEELARHEQVESVDVITGDWELIVKVRTKDIDEYYQFIRSVFAKSDIGKITSLNSMHQLKAEFILAD